MTSYTFGPILCDDGVEFRIWAPKQQLMRIVIDDKAAVPMQVEPNGWHVHVDSAAKSGTRYAFQLEEGLTVPDPASRHQPEDVHGPSEVVDSRFDWRCLGWRGMPWEQIVLYELHVGTFSKPGTFLGIIPRLEHLRNLGVTAIQLMPIADFPGSRNWGYDGVLPYAPDSSYGRPEDLKALVDAAHQHGLCVFLDVVYNHFGPDGNYLPSYAPLFADNHHTPWGAGINFDGEHSRQVRDFIIENAVYWIEEFRIDGLRLDAVHAIKDDSRQHVLDELAKRVHDASQGRQVHLVVENEENDSDLLARGRADDAPLFAAQWNDDLHHVLHVALTGEDVGYYADYSGDTHKFGRALAEGFAFQGEVMPYRGTPRGQPSGDLPPTAFVSFVQNHDQIGNRAFGDRLSQMLPTSKLRLAAALYLLAPQIPMLFMGEEWASRRPFPYFADFPGTLGEQVRDGRRKELKGLPGFHGEDAGSLPDPTVEETFLSAKLDWDSRETLDNADLLAFYTSLLALRRKEIVPRLLGIAGNGGHYEVREGVIHVRWIMGDASHLQLLANLSDHARACTLPTPGQRLLVEGRAEAGKLGPWSVCWSIREPEAR